MSRDLSQSPASDMVQGSLAFVPREGTFHGLPLLIQCHPYVLGLESGVIETDMTTPNLLVDETARQRSAARHPLGRVGQPEDVAYGVLYLASDEASFVTGSELVIDGGLTAQ